MGANWLDSLEEVGGPLVPVARVFLDSEPPGPEAAGPDGVRWLATKLEDFVDRDTGCEEDDRFVEGAGALLGLFLIDHLGGRTQHRDGRHRVQLGRFGWFDPFGAIQDVLDAEDPRACFADCLRLAEREADECGPVSRILRIFADELHRLRPDLEIREHFELTVELDNGATVDLTRLERIGSEADAHATVEAARRLISMLPGAGPPEVLSWDEAATRLVPRLVSTSFLKSLSTEQTLHTDDLALHVQVCVAFQLRYGSRARYVTAQEVDRWQVDRTEVRQRAVENLASRSRSIRLEQIADHLFHIRQGDGLDGARLLLPGLASRLSRVGPGDWLAASPHRDLLLVAHKAGIADLAREAEDAFRRAPHPISASLFELTPEGTLPLQP